MKPLSLFVGDPKKRGAWGDEQGWRDAKYRAEIALVDGTFGQEDFDRLAASWYAVIAGLYEGKEWWTEERLVAEANAHAKAFVRKATTVTIADIVDWATLLEASRSDDT
jgi:hypothetical protein